MSEASQTVRVGQRNLRLSNLDKVLYPGTHTTKAEVIDYYARVAGVMLRHLADRPCTRKRWPDGVSGPAFFEKNVPRGTPSWVRTVTLVSPSSRREDEKVTYPLLDEVASVVWTANLAALELHVPQWRVGPRGAVKDPDRLVVDLDPGPGTGLAECADVAVAVRDLLDDDGLACLPVTSGSKGMQLYASISGRQDADAVRAYAKQLAEHLAQQRRDLVVANMAKALRPGKVLLDWSQNHRAKTTICPYSLRGRDQPWVAAPRSWDEVADPGSLRQLRFEEVLDRLDGDDDPLAPLFGPGPRLPA